jgi:oligopeptide/dipeptide ABC transporter ATP-binding protein
MSCLHVENLTVRFPTRAGTVTAVEDVSLDHGPGESLALVGETGCGKSVLALALMGLLPPGARVEGRILFEGRDLLSLAESELTRLRGRRIALVPQNPGLSLNPVRTVGSQLEELFRIHEGLSRREARARAERLLERMGIGEAGLRMRQYPFQFSEGMNQRVLIAAGFASSPRVLIADEPTRGLDEPLREVILRELDTVRKREGACLILITHDLKAARKLADRIAVMYGGRLMEVAPAGSLFQNPGHPYTRGLIGSLPENGFLPIPGPAPSMIDPPPGCRFAPRCRHRMEPCEREEPPLRRKETRWIRCTLDL